MYSYGNPVVIFRYSFIPLVILLQNMRQVYIEQANRAFAGGINHRFFSVVDFQSTTGIRKYA